MKSIENVVSNELIIKNSKFITYLFPLTSSNIFPIIEGLKEKHPKATHYCYAYIYDDVSHFSDDGEPSNTAGLPLFMVLDKNQLNHVLVVVIRYFGGIKLGAGGLVRAYTKAITSCLENAKMVQLIPGYFVKIISNYQDSKKLDYLLKDYSIVSREYLDDVITIVEIPKDQIDKIQSFSYEILKEEYILKSY